jgi:AcrR family transcriptional regulator
LARRGDQLRDHILLAAKDVFLEVGFDRASMDLVAARAETSKRTLYAHFGSKDNLFLAVAELVQRLYLDRLKTPDSFGDDPREAVVLFCGRFLEILVWGPVLRTCRMGISEAERAPNAAAGYYSALFEMAQARLAVFLRAEFGLTRAASDSVATGLLGRALYPRFIATLFGVTPPLEERPEGPSIAAVIDLRPIRRAVEDLLPPSRPAIATRSRKASGAVTSRAARDAAKGGSRPAPAR